MPLSSEQALQVVALILLGGMSAFGAACIAFVLRFRVKIARGSIISRNRRSYPAGVAASPGAPAPGGAPAGAGGIINLRHLREFNSPWLLRVLLCALGLLWLLLELLRLPLLRNKGWALHGLGFNAQANLCRCYVLLSLGLAEPAFFLTALFLVRESLTSDPFSFTRRRWRFRALALVSLLSLPVLLVQLFFAFITPAVEYPGAGFALQKEGYGGAIPRSFTLTFVNQTRVDPGSGRSTIAASCRIPLLSTVAMGVFGVLYVIYFLYLGWRMILLVINKRLQVRVYALLLAIVVLVPLHLLLLGLSSSALSKRITYEIVAFIRLLTSLSCVCLGQWMLVIRPITDAIAVLEASIRRGGVGGSMKVVGRLNSWGAIPIDQLSLPLSATFSVDEDRSSLITELSVELASKDGVEIVVAAEGAADAPR